MKVSHHSQAHTSLLSCWQAAYTPVQHHRYVSATQIGLYQGVMSSEADVCGLKVDDLLMVGAHIIILLSTLS